MSGNTETSKVTRWIVALCVTVALAIVGWTTTANLAIRIGNLEEIKKDAAEIRISQQANNIRISVLENKYDTIQATLVEIKMILQKMREKD